GPLEKVRVRSLPVPTVAVTPSRTQREPLQKSESRHAEHRQPAPSIRPTDPNSEGRFRTHRLGSLRRKSGRRTSRISRHDTGGAALRVDRLATLAGVVGSVPYAAIPLSHAGSVGRN